ncbi:MAG: DEAD/DEAH box helicase, partial [Acidobacteria bacterium]|nr:DEAD/DEAH box helicase [Acidobacteriota bacterium]
KYLFFLSATPVQNNLIELFNLITLLKPGTLKTEAEFRREYVKRGNPQEPVHPDKLRELLRGVMIRNTRSLVDLKLPRRFATTLTVAASPAERDVYDAVSALVRGRRPEDGLPDNKTLFSTLLREAGSSPFALRATLSNYPATGALREILDRMAEIQDTEKGIRLVRLLGENPGEKTIIFSQFRKTLDYLAALLPRHGIRTATYHGRLSRSQKEEAIRSFREEVPVLLAAESGGEGHNLQCAHSLVNYDLPWNPMRIEQRIGRLQRVGQTRDVFIFNLCLKDTLEHYLLEVLEKKINLFELVVGEVDMILGNLDPEREFADVVFDLWRSSRDDADARSRFERLGEELVAARERYRESTRLDDLLFREEFEV